MIEINAAVGNVIRESRKNNGYRVNDARGLCIGRVCRTTTDNDLCDTAVTPIYKTFKGWQADLTNIRSFSDVPEALADYVYFLEDTLGLPINFISTSPDREAIIHRQAVIA